MGQEHCQGYRRPRLRHGPSHEHLRDRAELRNHPVQLHPHRHRPSAFHLHRGLQCFFDYRIPVHFDGREHHCHVHDICPYDVADLCSRDACGVVPDLLLQRYHGHLAPRRRHGWCRSCWRIQCIWSALRRRFRRPRAVSSCLSSRALKRAYIL